MSGFSIPAPARTVLRRIRRAPERYLHPLRRARFRRALLAHEDPSILVACLGNICRSPYAEHRLRADLAERGVWHLDITSAGFVQPDRPSPQEAQRVAVRRGLDLSDHRSVVLDAQILRNADLIFVMSRRQRRDLVRKFGRSEGVLVLGDGDPRAIESRTIKDPVEKPEAVFEVVYDRVDRCCALVIESLAPDAMEARAADVDADADVDAAAEDSAPRRSTLRMVAGR